MSQYPIVCIPGLAGADSEFAALASSLRRPVLAALDRPAIVLGHSHGGLVALGLAAAHPGLVAAVVLLDAPVALPPPARLLARLPRAWLPAFFKATFRAADTAPWRAEVLARLAAVPPATARAVLAESCGGGAAVRLSTVDALGIPVLCVRANVPIRADRLPAGVRVVDLPGHGHWPHVHAPERVAAALRAFLAAADAGDRGAGQAPGPRVPGEGVPVDGDVELEVQPHRPGH